MSQLFEFELGQEVMIERSGEQGEIIGRAEYLNADDNYLLRYKASDGRCVEVWWSQNAIVGI